MLGQINIIPYIKYKYDLSTFYLLIVILFFKCIFVLIFVCMNESNFEIKIINCYKGIYKGYC